MAFKTTYARNKHTILQAGSGFLDVCYTVPGGKTFLLRDLHVNAYADNNIGSFNQPVFLQVYVLPSGGTDAAATATTPEANIATSATIVSLTESAYFFAGQPSIIHPRSKFTDSAATARTDPITYVGILNAGDAVKVKTWGQAGAGTSLDLTYTIVIGGDEYTP